MPLKLFGVSSGIGTDAMTALQAQIEVVRQAAETADGKAANARQMVLSRDPALTAAGTQAAAAETQATNLATQVMSLAQLAANVTSLSDASTEDRKQLNTRTAALEAALALLQAKAIEKREKRVTTTQILALGATVDLTVTWDQPFVDANYLPIPLLDSTGGLANVGPIGVKAGTQTKTGCVITVRANVAVAAGLAVNVVGLRFG